MSVLLHGMTEMVYMVCAQQVLLQNQNSLGTMSVCEKMPICSGGCTTQLQQKDMLLGLLSSGCRYLLNLRST